ncbi:MAG TPA: beta-1,3-glucanase family protein [Dactylosporangium sp.]|nr:beta-1,3-glucanase family protein [Dactylosporangium sp.]
MNFTNSSGAVVTSFSKPDSDSVFGCYKLLDAPNDLVRGPISRTLCAGYNRTTLLTSAEQPYNVPSAFYQDPVTNQFAKAVHAQMIDGKAYAFAFDDVGNNESLVHDDSPTSAGIILDPFTGGNGGTPTPSPTPSRTPSASPTPSTSPSCTPGAAQLLSQGRPATASSNESGSSAALAVDGNTATRWSSQFADPQWLQVDLGASKSISRVSLNWEAAHARAYRIETSPDAVNWTTFASVTNGDGGIDTLTGSGTGRYVRMYATQRATAWGDSLWEFQVYGATPCTTPTGGTFTPTQRLLANGTLSGSAGPAGSLTVAAANGNHDGTPTNALTFTASGLTGAYTGGATAFDLAVDSGTGVGNGLQARISYDLTGDGTYDRIETYRYFPTDPVAGWEHYTQAQGLSAATGALGNLAGGRVRVEVWSAIGGTAGTLGVGNLSQVTLPFS